MEGVNFLNIEYFVVLFYRLITGTNVDATQIPAQTLALLESLAWLGILAAIIFLVFLIYVHMRLHAVTHEGWHHRDEEAHKRNQQHTLRAGKNPQWEHIKLLMSSTSQSDWRSAIIEADIMLDSILSDHGYRGASLGDKLRGANPLQFTTLDLAWRAHTVRNDIAHGGERFILDEREAKATIDLYKRVFEEFNAI